MGSASPWRDRVEVSAGFGLLSLLVVGVAGGPGIRSTGWTIAYGVLVVVAGLAIPLVYAPLHARAPDEGRKILAVITSLFAWWVMVSAPLTAHVAADEPIVVVFPVLGLATLVALAAAPSRRIAAGILFGTYLASLAAWLFRYAAGLYLPRHSTLGMFGFLGLAATCPLILAWALRSRLGSVRQVIALPALALAAFVVLFPPLSLDRWANERFLSNSGLNAFAARVAAYAPIHSLWLFDVTRVNQVVVTGTNAERDSARSQLVNRGREVMLERDLLARDGIDPAVYSGLRREMHRYHLAAYHRRGEYVQFRRTYRGCGMVYAPVGTPLVRPGDSIPGTRIRVVERVGRWHSCGAF